MTPAHAGDRREAMTGHWPCIVVAMLPSPRRPPLTARGCYGRARAISGVKCAMGSGNDGRRTRPSGGVERPGRVNQALRPEGRRAAGVEGTVAEYQCLPDTVDPRGPKGK